MARISASLVAATSRSSVWNRVELRTSAVASLSMRFTAIAAPKPPLPPKLIAPANGPNVAVIIRHHLNQLGGEIDLLQVGGGLLVDGVERHGTGDRHAVFAGVPPVPPRTDGKNIPGALSHNADVRRIYIQTGQIIECHTGDKGFGFPIQLDAAKGTRQAAGRAVLAADKGRRPPRAIAPRFRSCWQCRSDCRESPPHQR